MIKPNFIIAGFPKCGTTSLHYYLDEHPEIFMPKKKELHFFTYQHLSQLNSGPKDKIVNQTHVGSAERYLSYFKGVKEETAIGDTSPSYINYPSLFPKIKKYLNDPKVIIMLRDPVNRAYSNYLHLKREQREKLTFKQAIKIEKERKKSKYSDFWYYKFNSMYSQKIIGANKVFSKILILTLEELNKNPTETMKKVYLFLDVDANFKPQATESRYNVGGIYENNFFTKIIFQPSLFKNYIKRIVKPSPFIKKILMYASMFFISKPEKIDKKLLNELKIFFKKDVGKLSDLNVDISNWRKY
tara:strand:- start:2068 stop:2967 length:900 start_codon:yes stop_codon:yes gene_type:complete